MKITRRLFAFFAFTASLAVLALAGAAGRSPASHSYLALVGTYTDKTGSKGIYAYEFDAETGKLTAKGLAAEARNPSWLVVHPSGKFVYAADESGPGSMIAAFTVDLKTAKLTEFNQIGLVSPDGNDPCHLSFDKTGKYLIVAYYTSGNVAVFPILADGKLGEHTALLTDEGVLGPNKKRQEGPHAHWIGLSERNRFAYVADLGLDRVLIYNFDAAKGTLARIDPASLSTEAGAAKPSDAFTATLSPGTGPRHVTFSPDGKFMYVLGELQSTVTVFANGAQETYREIQSISALPERFKGRNDAAEIALHPGGRWLYTSNRGHDTIAAFAVDPEKGILRKTGDFPTGGKEPRHFAIDPTGRFLLAENQLSNSIVVFGIDPVTGALSQVSKVEGVPSPVCLAFLPTP